MEFRLLYSGRLLGASRDKTRAEHKHAIRCELSPQIRRLVESKFNLYQACYRYGFKWFENHPEDRDSVDGGMPHDVQRRLMYGFFLRHMAEKWQRGGHGFVPIVTEEMELRVALDILFLRPVDPGMIIKGGDLDNRLKTLLDALRLPDNAEGVAPQASVEPIFCLLQDDRLISEIKMTSDQLLLLPKESAITPNDVFLVVNVALEAPPSSAWHHAFG